MFNTQRLRNHFKFSFKFYEEYAVKNFENQPTFVKVMNECRAACYLLIHSVGKTILLLIVATLKRVTPNRQAQCHALQPTTLL